MPRFSALLLWMAVGCLCALGQTAPPSTSPGTLASPPPQPQSITLSNTLAKLEGLRIESVDFRGLNEDPVVVNQLRNLLRLPVGSNLNRAALRRGIQELYATGRFTDIRVDANRTDGTVALIVTVKPNFFIGAVTVTGAPKRPPANQLINTSKLRLGEVFTEEKIARAAINMKQVLADNGFYQAVVKHHTVTEPSSQRVNVHFNIERGEAARIGKISVSGNAGYSEQEVIRISKLETGDEVSGTKVTRALQRLRSKYQDDQRLEAQVTIAQRTYHPESNTLDYVFAIQRGPDVDFHVEGAKLSKRKLRKYVPVFEESAVDDDLLNEGRRNIRDYFQTKGYFDVEVDFRKEADPAKDHLHIVYDIDRGNRHKLVAVRITGNRYFTTDDLLERMAVRPASGLLTHGRYSQTLLARDRESIENLYKANGFRDVKVDAVAQNQVEGDPGRMVVVVNVQEGPQTRVNEVTFSGVKAVSEDELRDLLWTQPGQPFSDANLGTDRDTLANFYFNRGFPDMQFEAFPEVVDGDPYRMNVEFRIKEGDQVFVDNVRLFGMNYTRQFVVQREVELQNREPLNQLHMLETQRRLYDLGIFNQVDMAIQNPDGSAKYKDVLFQVSEARRWTFNYGLGLEVQTGGAPRRAAQLNTAPGPGVDVPDNTTPPTSGTLTEVENPPTFSPRVSFEMTRLNFRGRDHTVTLKTQLGLLQQRGLVSYDAPRWFDKRNLRLTFSAYYDNSRDVNTFTARRLEASVQAEHKPGNSRTTTLLYRLQYRRVSVDENSLAISPDLVPLYSRPVRVGMPSFTWIRDLRDDPIETRRGNYTTVDFGVASKVFGSQSNFTRLTLQNSSYQQFRKGWVFARQTRLGLADPYGSTVREAGGSTINLVPLPERFFGGGGTSHRGFTLNQAGPRDLTTGFPVGGNAIFVNTFELRTPRVELPALGENLGFVLFHDMGNVFDTGRDMLNSFGKWTQKNRSLCLTEATHQQCDFNYLSHAVGIGARYRTPIGPVRVDVSYNLNSPSFPYFVQCAPIPLDDDGKPETVEGPCATLPVGTVFFQSGTLRRLNFFFSIGQTF